ncbi:MAG: PAS domain S-box protein, partial [Pseudomonadales bacterium]|nr:PAS domain S-box protein [Pseudomonadales bacterium]
QRANERRLRHEAEKRYSERLQLYIESLEEATDCVLIADENKNLMYANNAIKSILGLTPAEAVGRPLTSVLFSHDEDATAALQGLRQEGRWHAEVRNQRDDQYVTIENTISAVRNSDDNETAYISISRDVTDRKKTEAELENHRRNLEFLVAERTKALEREIRENKEFQHELANSLREKELLLKEVHHRVKNNMQVISSLLNIQSETIGNESFATLLGESQQRIKSMSLIHENLYQSDNLLEIDFEDYIKMLTNSLCRFYAVPGVSINLDVQVVDVSLDLETAVPCGLIINELVSNSLKHAYRGFEGGSGTISIWFRREGCRYVLEVKDDGGGLPEDFSLSNTSSMGMEIVSILTQQIDGRLCFANDGGAAFEISFPGKQKNVQ